MREALRVTFVRLSKNASTSIYQQLGDRNVITDERLKQLFVSDIKKYKGIFAPSHCSLQEAVMALGSQILNYPSFCVIRNAYDRFVSMYSFSNKMGFYSLYGEDSGSFLEFARYFYKNRKDSNFFHTSSQLSNIKYNGQVAVKHMLDFQNINKLFKDFIEVYNVVGVNPNLPQKNTTKHKHYSEYYCTESKNIVEEIWQEDFEYFKFKYEEN